MKIVKKETFAFIKERIGLYQRELDSVRERISQVTPEKWLDDDGYKYSDSETEMELESTFEDLTPCKGSVSKIEAKREIFEMIRYYNSFLRKKLGLISLNKFQVMSLQKLQSGKLIFT